MAGHKVPRPSSNPRIKYEARKLDSWEDWVVEAVDYRAGCSYLTVFEGSYAESRAKEYAEFKNRQLENII